MPVYDMVITIDLVTPEACRFQFLVKKEAGAGAEISIDNPDSFFPEIRNAVDLFWIAFLKQNTLLTFTKIHNGRHFVELFRGK